LDAQGTVWVTDFGLARDADAGNLTQTGDFLGTLRYMAPERFRGRSDARGDVYGLGITLYELLTLRPAFAGEDREELLRQIAFDDPAPPRRLNRAVPAELETIVLEATARNREERYATAQELADDLNRFLSDEPIRARPPTLWQRARRWSRRHRPVVAAAGGLLLTALLLGGGGAWWEYRQEQGRQAAGQAHPANGDDHGGEPPEDWRRLATGRELSRLSLRRGRGCG